MSYFLEYLKYLFSDTRRIPAVQLPNVRQKSERRSQLYPHRTNQKHLEPSEFRKADPGSAEAVFVDTNNHRVLSLLLKTPAHLLMRLVLIHLSQSYDPASTADTQHCESFTSNDARSSGFAHGDGNEGPYLDTSPTPCTNSNTAASMNELLGFRVTNNQSINCLHNEAPFV